MGNFFVNFLFVHKTQLRQKKFKRIISADILRFHYAFLGIVGNEPSGKYTDPTHNPFHQNMISVIVVSQTSMETFRKWQYEVIGGFNETIGWQMRLQILSKVLQKGMSIVIVSLG